MTDLWTAWRDACERLLHRDVVPRRTQRLVLLAVIVSCAAIRLWTIVSPPLDRSRWKEIDYLQISRNYYEHGFQFLRPEIAWPAEEPRVTAMELPLVPFVTALGYTVAGINEYSARALTFLAFTLLPVYVFLLARRELGPVVAMLASLAAAIMPLYHPFGRFVFSEPPMILASVATLYHLAEWIDWGARRHLAGAFIGFSLAIALKLEPLYLLLPMSWIAVRRYGAALHEYRGFIALVAAALVLPAAWYAYAYYLTLTSIDVFGIFQGHNKMQTLTMLSRPEWYVEMASRLVFQVLGGYAGTLLATIGLLTAAALRRGAVIAAYLAAVAVSFVIVAEGNIDAPYRQLPSEPPLSIFAGMGAMSLAAMLSTAWRARTGRDLSRPVMLAVSVALVAAVPLQQREAVLARDVEAPGHRSDWELKEIIDQHAKAGDRLVTAGMYTIHVGGNDPSPVIYHYTGLQGWSLQRGGWTLERVEEYRRRGAAFFAAIRMSREPDAAPFMEAMRRRYPALYENSERELLLLDLR